VPEAWEAAWAAWVVWAEWDSEGLVFILLPILSQPNQLADIS
jgi:hypothetical protein